MRHVFVSIATLALCFCMACSENNDSTNTTVDGQCELDGEFADEGDQWYCDCNSRDCTDGVISTTDLGCSDTGQVDPKIGLCAPI